MIKAHLTNYPIKKLPLRIKKSTIAIIQFLYFRPAYLALSAIISVLFYEISYWTLHFQLLQYLILNPTIPTSAKISLVASSYTAVFSLPVAWLLITLFAISIAQGVSIGILVYLLRRQKANNASISKSIKSTSLIGIFSALGVDCVACGTSLITPILSIFFATSSVALAREIGMYSAIFALILSIIALHSAGYKLSFAYHPPSK